MQDDIAHHLIRPARVVVRRRIGGGIVLNREIHVGNRAQRLVTTNNPVALLDVNRTELHVAGGDVKLESLVHQFIHRFGGVGLAMLPRRNHPPLNRANHPLLDRVLVLDPVVLKEAFTFFARVPQCVQHRRFLNVRVGPRPPANVVRRGVRTIPLATLVVIRAAKYLRQRRRRIGRRRSTTSATATAAPTTTTASASRRCRITAGATTGRGSTCYSPTASTCTASAGRGGREWARRTAPATTRGDPVTARAIALYFIEATNAVVRVHQEEHVVRHPAIVEAIRPHARHALLRHFHHVVLGHIPPFVDGDGIELFVVGAGARGHIEQRLRFVQVMQNRRMPLVGQVAHVLRELEVLAHAVAIVVMRDVLAPVRRRQIESGALSVAGAVHNLVATVGLNDRRNHRQHVLANAGNHRRLVHHQPIGQLHQHLGSTRLGGVHATREIVHRLGETKQLLRARLRSLARIGEFVQVALVVVEIADGLFIGDDEHHHVSPLFRLADRPELRARGRSIGDGLEIAIDVARLGEIARCPDNAIDARELERRRHLVGKWHVVHQVRGDARVGEILLDQPRVLLVLLLRGLRRQPGRSAHRRPGDKHGPDETTHRRCHARHPASFMVDTQAGHAGDAHVLAHSV